MRGAAGGGVRKLVREMAILRDCLAGTVYRTAEEIREVLEPRQVWYRRREIDAELAEGASDEEVLAAFEGPIAELRRERDYPAADVVEIRPGMPGLEETLARFAQEHWHDDDEVRFIVAGRGIFHLHFEDGAVFAVEVRPGDLIQVPARTLHWFHVGPERRVRAVRLFTDPAGWVPHYTGSDLSERYPPVWEPVAKS